MATVMRRISLRHLVPLVALCAACGEAPTTPLDLGQTDLRPAYSASGATNACLPPGFTGWVVVDGGVPMASFFCVAVVVSEGVATMSVLTDPGQYATMANPVWFFQVDDTLDALGVPPVGPLGAAGGEEVCRGGLSCVYEPEESGRIYVTFTWLVPHAPTVEVWGPILWATPDPCGIGASSAAGVPSKADGPDDGTVCPPAGTGELSLSCVPDVVVRAETDVVCTAGVDPAETSLAITGWIFVSSEHPGLAVSSVGHAPEWKGPMVSTGVVTVKAMVDGRPDSASAAVQVEPRDWSGRIGNHQIRNGGQGPLPPAPDSAGELGRTVRAVETIVREVLGVVPTGPNSGVGYLTDVPFQITQMVYWNEEALSKGSAFWRSQPSQAPAYSNPPVCTQRDVMSAPPLVLRHEGYPENPTSHTGVYADYLRGTAGAATEGLVSNELQVLFNQADDVLERLHVAAADLGGERFDKKHPVPFGCEFSFTYPNGKTGGKR